MKKIASVLLFFLSLSYCISQNSWLPNSSPDWLYFNGIQQYSDGKYAAAMHLLKSFLAVEKNTDRALDAQYYTAVCMLMNGHEAGETQIKKFVEQYPHHPKSVYANFDIGSYYFFNKQYELATFYLSKVNLTMLDEANKLECNFRLGYSYMYGKEFDKAAAVFQRIKTSKNKYTYAANYYLGYVNFKKELYEIAEQNLLKAAENESYAPLVPQILSHVYLKQQKYDTLIQYGKRVFTQLPQLKNPEEVQLNMAEAYYAKKKYTDAFVYFQQHIQGNPKPSSSTLFKYGFSLYKTEQYSDAIEQFKKISEIYDSTGQAACYYMGMSWLKLNNKTFAYNALNQARKMPFLPDISAKAAIEYGKLAIETQKFTDAIEALGDYNKKYPDAKNTDVANAIVSEAYLYNDDPNSGIKYIEPIRNKTGIIAKAYQQLTHLKGIELYNNEQYDEAAEWLEKSLNYEQDKDLALLTYYQLGECYAMLNKLPEATASYLKAQKGKYKLPDDIALKNEYGLGYAFYNRQDYVHALPCFKEFTDKAPKNPSVSNAMLCDGLIRLADVYYANKKFNDAQLTYQKAIDIKCADADYAWLQKGINLALLNKLEEAKTCFRKLIDSYPQSAYLPDAWYNLGLVDFENAKFEASLPAFAKVINKHTSNVYTPLALQKRALAYTNLKQYENAVQDYEVLLSQYPTHKSAESALSGLQSALVKLNRSSEMDLYLEVYKQANPQNTQVEKLVLERAKNLYFDQKYAEAVEKFEKYLNDYPTAPSVAEAKYFLADSYWRNGNTESAKEAFEEVIEDTKGVYYTRSLSKLGDIFYEEKNYSEAIPPYLKLIAHAKNDKEKVAAYSGLMQCYYYTNKYDSAYFYTQKLLAAPSSTANYVAKAYLYAAKASLALTKPEAVDWLNNTINSATDVHAAEAMYLLAHYYYEEKKHKVSLELLFDLSKRFTFYPFWIGQAFLLIADNYAALGETYQAKATLMSIIEKAPDKELADEAKLKLSKLDNP